MPHRMPRALPLTVVIVGLACVAVAASGCATGVPKGGEINKVNWVLTSYSDSGMLKDAPQGTNGSAWFADDNITGRVLNTYQSPFVAGANGNVTRVGPITSTKLAGPPDLMAVEDAYLADLQKATSYYSDGKTLTLYGDGDEKLIVYQAGDVTVVGKWRVIAYNNGKQAVVSVISTTTLTADFSNDGKVTGEGGINAYNGDYSLQGGNEISVGTINAAQMTGPPEVMAQQTAYLAALESAKTYQVAGTRLELRTADGAIAVQMERAE